MSVSARPYQVQAIESVMAGWYEYSKQLLVLPTGAGKSCVFAWIADRIKGRTLVLAHREELVNQAIEKIHAVTGIRAGKEKAEFKATHEHEVVVASVQSMMRRLDRWPDDHFDLIVCDEAHHSISKSWMNVLNHFDTFASVLGVTATPDRGDKRNLGCYYENVAFEVSMFDLIRQGFLSKIAIKTCPLKLDISGVKQKAGDYDAGQLGASLDPYLREIARSIKEHAADRRSVVFMPLIATSEKFVAICKEEGLRAEHVDGYSPDRKEILERFAACEFDILSNAMLLCLDEKTEILTDSGWKTYDTIKESDRVANWQFDGTVFFKEPEEIVHRDLYANEHMVSIESRTINIRVTNTHRMIVGCGAGNGKWKKIPANDLRSGHVLPSCGVFNSDGDCQVEDVARIPSKRAISANAFNLRKHNGYSWDDSIKEATRREGRRCSLVRKNVTQLTDSECKFIGFWIADGTKTKLQKGGVEYVLTQSTAYPEIIRWIDAVIKDCGFHSLKKLCDAPKKGNSQTYFKWSLCRGTGGGSQQREGLYPVEAFLNKEGFTDAWHMSQKQFNALVEGYWYGDGHHGQAENGMPDSIIFNDTKFKWIELLCSVGPVKGWQCRMSTIRPKNPKHNTQYALRMMRGSRRHISDKTPIIHEQYNPEKVWCVKTKSKNIITRRNGIVTVMGNTEGFDDPGIDCVVNLRPTKSRSLYSQIIGRGTRIAPGKKNLLLLDFLWMHEKHNLVRPAHLVAESEEIAEEMTEISEKAGGQCELDLEGLASDAQVQREEKIREMIKAREHEESKLIDAVSFCEQLGDPEAAEFEPSKPWQKKPMTSKQEAILKKQGVNLRTVNGKGHAMQLIDALFKHQNAQPATDKQRTAMKRAGIENAENATKGEAKAFFAARNHQHAEPAYA